MQGNVRVITNKNVKRLPQGEEIEPGTEAALRDDHQRARVAGETLRQAISTEKNVASLFQTVVIGKVNIVEISGNRCTLSVEFQVGGLYGVLFHVSYSNHKA